MKLLDLGDLRGWLRSLRPRWLGKCRVTGCGRWWGRHRQTYLEHKWEAMGYEQRDVKHHPHQWTKDVGLVKHRVKAR